MRAIKGLAIAALIAVMSSPAYAATEIATEGIPVAAVGNADVNYSESISTVTPGDSEKPLAFHIRRNSSSDDE